MVNTKATPVATAGGSGALLRGRMMEVSLTMKDKHASAYKI